MLDALDRHAPSVTWKDTLSREASKRLNLLVKHRQIGSLDLESLRRTCDRLIGEVAVSIADAAASPPPAAAAAATP